MGTAVHGHGEVHLEQVAVLAEEFAAKFSAPQWGQLAGLWHDLGKYSAEFEQKLENESGPEIHIEQRTHVDHSTAGAQRAARVAGPWGRLLAFAIAGHHAGLADVFRSPSSLEELLEHPHHTLRKGRTMPGLTITEKALWKDRIGNRSRERTALGKPNWPMDPETPHRVGKLTRHRLAGDLAEADQESTVESRRLSTRRVGDCSHRRMISACRREQRRRTNRKSD